MYGLACQEGQTSVTTHKPEGECVCVRESLPEDCDYHCY